MIFKIKMEITQLNQEQKFESLIQGLVENNYGLEDYFIEGVLLEGLRENLNNYRSNGEMYPAGIGKKFDFQKNAEVRGDLIRWIDKNSDNPFEQNFIQQIEAFIQYLNQTCYTSINDYEFHYASYEVGSFYKRHLDQFKSDRGRKYSLVVYLNENWQEKDGGNIALYFENERIENVYPLGGRAIFFKSDELEHEVHPSKTRSRISIAGWLKNV